MTTPRQVAIQGLLERLHAGKIKESEVQSAFKKANVSQAEIDEAKQALQQSRQAAPVEPEKIEEPAEYDSPLQPAFVAAGPGIAQAIEKIVNIGIDFLPQESISSYAVHLLRFQARGQGNLARIETEAAMLALQGTVSLPEGSLCEVKPSKELGKPGFIDVSIPRADRQALVFSQKEVGIRVCNGRLQTLLGRNVYGDLVELDSFIHRAVIGESNGGKSNFIHQDVVINSLWNSPDYLRYVFIDMERRTFARFDNWPWNFCAPLIESNKEEWDSLLAKLLEEYRRRSLLFQECEDILRWNAENPDKPEPIIMVMVEELGELNNAFGRDSVDQFLIKMSERGRALGFYLTLSMQRMAQDSAKGIIDPRVANNLQTIIIFKSSRQAANLVDCPAASTLRGSGDGLARINNVWTRFQAWHLGDNKAGILEGLANYGRSRYGDRCYSKPMKSVQPAADPWTVEDEEGDRASLLQQHRVIKEMQSKNASQAAIARAVFPEARAHKQLNGGTLAAFTRRIEEICAEVENQS